MTILGFQERFVPRVEAGWLAHTGKRPTEPPKTHSIRALPKTGQVRFKVGDKAQLYRRVRQKDMRKIVEVDPTVTKVEHIVITNLSVRVDGRRLPDSELVDLAIADGFEGLRDFGRFFLPPGVDSFEGHIIHWSWA